MAYRRIAGLAAVLVVIFAASTMVVHAGDATDEQSVYDWTVLKIKDITDSAYTTASGVYENSKKHAETLSNSAKEYTDYAKDSFTKATSGKKEPESKTLDLLEQSKKAAFNKYQAAKDNSAESAESAKKQYDTVNAKLSELTQQVKDKMTGTHEEL